MGFQGLRGALGVSGVTGLHIRELRKQFRVVRPTHRGKVMHLGQPFAESGRAKMSKRRFKVEAWDVALRCGSFFELWWFYIGGRHDSYDHYWGRMR